MPSGGGGNNTGVVKNPMNWSTLNMCYLLKTDVTRCIHFRNLLLSDPYLLARLQNFVTPLISLNFLLHEVQYVYSGEN